MKDVLIKKINGYFHDEESGFFESRHSRRINRESRFFNGLFARLLKECSVSLRILDIGTGKGLVPRLLSGKGHRLICADISFGMLKSAREGLGRDGSIGYVACDAERLPFGPGSFDLVVCNAAMHHFPSVNDFLAELDLVLVKGGKAIIGFESNRRFWKNAAVCLPYRLISRFLTCSNGAPGYDKICARVNAKLVEEGLTDKPLSMAEMMGHVDVHSPNAGDKIDDSKGFEVSDLTRFISGGYKHKVIYHYDIGPGLFNFYNRVLFPGSAPRFSLILEKSDR